MQVPAVSSPNHARQLADYFDAQARTLRKHALDLETSEKQKTDKMSALENCGRMALELIDSGLDEKAAVWNIANDLGIYDYTVATRLKIERQDRDRNVMQSRNRTIIALAQKGQTVRDIAGQFGLCKSTIHKVIKSG